MYEKFDGYVPRSEAPEWGTGGKVAHFPRIEWHIITDPATAGAALQRGRGRLVGTADHRTCCRCWRKDRDIDVQIADPQGRDR